MQLGRLAQTMPQLGLVSADLDATNQWLGKLDALFTTDDDVDNRVALRAAIPALVGARTPLEQSRAARAITIILHRALAAAELRAPVSAKGSFIPAGNAFDAMSAIGKVLGTAKHDVLIVDPYMDEKALTDFASLAVEGIAVRLLADEKDHKPTLRPAQGRWVQQYGTTRPLEVRLAPARVLHDRLAIVDEAETYVLTQSLNAFAARSPAAVVRVVAGTSYRLPCSEKLLTGPGRPQCPVGGHRTALGRRRG